MAKQHHQNKGRLYLFDRSFDQKTRQKVREVPAMCGFSTGLADGWGAVRKANHTPFVLYFFHWTSHILTHFQLWAHENTHMLEICDDTSFQSITF